MNAPLLAAPGLAERLGAVRDDAAPRPKPALGTLVFRHPGPEAP